MINTVGRWMIFRNYNWPISVRNKLFRVYANLLRMRKPASPIKAALTAAGYDRFDANPARANSIDKFVRCDLNVGDLLGPFGTPKALRTRSRGLHDLRALNVMPAGCCSPIDEWTWRFDGKTYVSFSKRKVKQTCPLDPSPPACSPNPP
ncbi:hypothetical protein LZC95_14290 [Pendulispora brunnea]|uniref:Uncharacterized protein n=1 Tax=Pendulispora brunnea TaxID=2905690 RepID=A0ABZ2KH37_9BACT